MNDPDDSLFDAEFLGRLRRLFFRLRKRRRLQRRGVQPTPSASQSREFKDHRPYTTRDDYRSIDWRLFARLERLFVRLYEDIQEFHVHILIDRSRSMAEPWSGKRRVALRAALALAYLGLANQHRVSLLSVDSSVRRELRPVKGQGQIHELIRRLEILPFDGVTNLREAFGAFRPARDRRGIVFFLSDLFGRDLDDATDALRQAAAWPAETHVVQIVDPRDAEPDLDGEFSLRDAETGEERRVYLGARERAACEAAFRDFCDQIETACLARRMNYLRWNTTDDFEAAFLELLARGSALANA